MTTNELLERVFSRNDVLLTLWNIYIAIAFGLVAFLASERRPTHPQTPIVALVAFAIFAWSHLMGLWEVVEQWRILAEAAKANVSSDPHLAPLVNHLNPPNLAAVIGTHLVIDLIVVSAIFILYRTTNRSNATQKQ